MPEPEIVAIVIELNEEDGGRRYCDTQSCSVCYPDEIPPNKAENLRMFIDLASQWRQKKLHFLFAVHESGVNLTTVIKEDKAGSPKIRTKSFTHLKSHRDRSVAVIVLGLRIIVPWLHITLHPTVKICRGLVKSTGVDR